VASKHQIKKVFNDLKNPEDLMDSKLYDLLLLITTDDDLKKVSGISKNNFVLGAIKYYGEKKSFSPKYKSSLANTLKVYRSNMVNQKLIKP
jgi:hypothetical protein